MGLVAVNLREGLTVAFHCLGTHFDEARQFLKGFSNGRVVLTGTKNGTDQMDDGTGWIVHETTNPGVFTFECDGIGQFLDGRSLSCDVVLADRDFRDGIHIGTQWKVSDLPDPDLGGISHVTLQCQGDRRNPDGTGCSFGFLDGDTFNNLIRLQIDTSENKHSGTHWELTVWEPVLAEGGGTPPPDGKPT